MLSPPSRSCFPWILLTGCLIQKVTKTLRISSFELGFPPQPKVEHVNGWFQLAPHHFYVPWSGGGATNSTRSGQQPSAPFPLRFLGLSSSSQDTCALLWQEEMWKIRYYFVPVPVELVNLRSFLSDKNGGEFCCIGLCPVLASTFLVFMS